MECRNSLEYTCPSHGGWGMVRIGMLIPESHQLFVCPSACGRHGALGAIKQGLKKRLSYLYLEESDVISGYDSAIYEAVDELLERLQTKPKVLIVFVSCLDDLIGTDCDAVIDELSMRYPDIKFRMGHMNPIQSDSDEPPLVSIWKNVYSLMEYDGAERKPEINLLGNYVPLAADSEFISVMKQLGISVSHVGNMSKYEELRNMGNNSLNLLVTSPVEKVAKLLKRTQGIDYFSAPVTYHLDEIKENYRAIFQKLVELEVLEEKDARLADVEYTLKAYEKKAAQAILNAKAKVGDKKLYIDYSAFTNPFSAARFFAENGFAIQKVYAKEIDEADASYQWLINESQIEIVEIKKHDIVNKWREKEDGIAIGLEAAYVSGSKYVVPVFQDEQMYGYYGVCLLMEKLIDCVNEERDLEEVINQAGLVV